MKAFLFYDIIPLIALSDKIIPVMLKALKLVHCQGNELRPLSGYLHPLKPA